MNDIGYLYAISDGTRVKIGKSKKPKERTSKLINTCGISNSLIFISNECSLLSQKELACHNRFADKEISGEWFDIPFGLAVSEIKKIAGNEDLTAKKQQDAEKSAETTRRISDLTESMMAKANNDYSELIKDTAELINICEGDSLIDELSLAGNSLVGILLVRCKAMNDVINQYSELTNNQSALISALEAELARFN